MTDKPRLEVVRGPNEDYDHRELRTKLGVDQNALLSPKNPQPVIHEGSPMDCLSHEEIFTPQECAKIIADHSPEQWEESAVAQGDKKTTDHDFRHSENHWIEKDESSVWLFDKMLALVMGANQFKWQFEIDFFESIQLAKYEEGMHYDWHYDLGPNVAGNRKLSLTVQLSAPDEYEGGELLLEMGNGEHFEAPRGLGSVTVFPSFLKHKVAPVTKGTRYSLVVWCSGTNRFR